MIPPHWLARVMAEHALPDESGSEANKNLVRRYEENVFNQGKVELIPEFVSEDAVNHNPLPNEVPGPQGVRLKYMTMTAAFSDLHVDVVKLLAESDHVAELLKISGRHTGEFIGLSQTGNSFSVWELNIYRIANGRIVERWGVIDKHAMVKQLRHLTS